MIFKLLTVILAVSQLCKSSTIVEANHFYSTLQLTTSYVIQPVNSALSLFIHPKGDNLYQNNSVKIWLEQGTECLIRGLSDLCAVEPWGTAANSNSQTLNMKLECQKLPCEFSWRIIQPKLASYENNLNVEPLILYKVPTVENGGGAVLSVADMTPDRSNLLDVFMSGGSRKVQMQSEVKLLVEGSTDKATRYFYIEAKTKDLSVSYQSYSPSLAVGMQFQLLLDGGKQKKLTLPIGNNGYCRLDSSMTEIGVDGKQIIPTPSKKTDQISDKKQKQEQKNNSSLVITVTSPIKDAKPYPALKIPTSNNVLSQFSAVLPVAASSGSAMTLTATTPNSLLVIFMVSCNSTQEVQVQEMAYTIIRENDKIPFKLVGDKTAKSNQTNKTNNAMAYIKLPPSLTTVKVSKTTCPIQEGCQFTLSSSSTDVVTCSMSIVSSDEGLVAFRSFQNSKITLKLFMDSFVYLQRKVGNSSIKLMINQPSVLFYVKESDDCIPSASCYDKIGSSHQPVYSWAAGRKSSKIYIGVFGMDSCQFTLTAKQKDEPAIGLHDGQPFSYLFEPKQKEVIFMMNLTDKKPLTVINAAPVHSLLMGVFCPDLSDIKDKLTETKLEELMKAEGSGFYLQDSTQTLTKKDIKSKIAIIVLKKTSTYSGKPVHFTVVASTEGTAIRLDTGSQHHQTLDVKSSRQFIVEYEPKDTSYRLALFFYNKIGEEVKADCVISDGKKKTLHRSEHQITYPITDYSLSVELKEAATKFCHSSTCQLFIKIVNKDKKQLMFYATLLTQDTIVELQDGNWQSFSADQISSSLNFYFIPRHKSKSITITYHTQSSKLRVAFTVWKNDDANINPTLWPFPETQTGVIGKAKERNQVIIIQKEQLSQCWPNCVVLVSLIDITVKNGNLKNTSNVVDNRQTSQSFTIMASNNMFVLPPHTKFELVLRQGEKRYIMIDLRSVSANAQVTFYTNNALGQIELSASVYTENKLRCPKSAGYDGEKDVSFGQVETQVTMSRVIQLGNELQSSLNQEITNRYSICILAQATQDSKMVIDYSTDDDEIKQLMHNAYETIVLKSGDTKIYQVSAGMYDSEFKVKVSRVSGFPFIRILQCKKQGIQQCVAKAKAGSNKFSQENQDDIDDMLKVKDGDIQDVQSNLDATNPANFKKIDKTLGKQLLSKTQQFASNPKCINCVYLLRFYAQQPAEILLHIVSPGQSLELTENTIFTDFLNQNDVSSYQLTTLRKQQTVISVHVTEGDVKLTVFDFGSISIEKKSNETIKVLQVVLPATPPQQTHLGSTYTNSMTLSTTFSMIYLRLESLNPKKAASFTIVYSSGERQIFLEDGLVIDFQLSKSTSTRFIYQPVVRSPALDSTSTTDGPQVYLIIGMATSSDLFNLQLKCFYLTNAQDVGSAVQFTPIRPPMRKRTQSPSMMFALPAGHPVYYFELKSASATDNTVWLSINHQQVVLLPFDHQLPFVLTDDLTLLTDVSIASGYIHIKIKKCDLSSPVFSHTFDYNGFRKGDYTFTSQLVDEPYFEYIIKANTIGTLYMKFVYGGDDSLGTQGVLDVGAGGANGKMSMATAPTPTTNSALPSLLDMFSDEPTKNISLLSITVTQSPSKSPQGRQLRPGNNGRLDIEVLSSSEARVNFTSLIVRPTDGAAQKGGKDAIKIEYYMLIGDNWKDVYTQLVCSSSFFSTPTSKSSTPLPLMHIPMTQHSIQSYTFKLPSSSVSYIGIKAFDKQTGQQVYYKPIELVVGVWGQVSKVRRGARRLIATCAGVLVLIIALIVIRRSMRKKGYQELRDDREDRD